MFKILFSLEKKFLYILSKNYRHHQITACFKFLNPMDFETEQLHFLLVPFMSQSHLIPFTDMAKQLAHHALTVTILMTPLNADRFNEVLKYATQFNLSIHFLTLPFPCQEAGLPEGCENRDSIQSPDLVPGFFQASNLLQQPLEKWLQELQSHDQRISCIISDICLPWTTDTALKFKIPRIIFHGISCFTLFCCHNLTRYNVLDSVTSDSQPFLVPEIPDRIEFTKPQLPEGKSQHSPAFKAMLDRFKVAELSAEGVVVNTCEELELNYVIGYRKTVKNLWCIGPLALQNNYSISDNEHKTLKWLDSKKKSSVLYVCFGSLRHISLRQLKELGMGLEASKHAFIWVIREGDYSSELEKWLEEYKFQEKVKERGIAVKEWAPQVQILAHQATGGFLTHCGWNSTLEGISSGLPMITWPMFAEQFYNEKLIVQVLKIGVRIGVELPVIWGQEEEKIGEIVKMKEIKMSIDELMDESVEGEDRRRRAKDIEKMVKKAVEKGGSSYLNMTLLIKHVIEQLSQYNQSNG